MNKDKFPERLTSIRLCNFERHFIAGDLTGEFGSATVFTFTLAHRTATFSDVCS